MCNLRVTMHGITYRELFENNRLIVGEQFDPIQNFYNPLLTEFLHMKGYEGDSCDKKSRT